jgi:3-oxoacyl-[acyl-carrier protein] reductase
LTDYTLSAGAELASAGITANVVHPPVTDTGWVTQEVRDAVAHVAGPGEVAEVIAYLCEERAGLISRNILTLR